MAVEEPKKPQNAYWLYLSENRGAIEKEAGGKQGSVVGKLAGQKWKAMPAAAKKPFEEKAAKLKQDYEAALESFKTAGGVVGKRRQEKAAAKQERDGKQSRKAAKDPNRPKKPLTAYWMWLGEHRAALMKEVGGKSVTAVSKLAGERWKALPEKEKAPFEKKAAELKAEYTKTMQAYKETTGDAGDDAEDEDVDGEEEN